MGKFGKQLIESMQQAAKHATGEKTRMSGGKSSDGQEKTTGQGTKPRGARP